MAFHNKDNNKKVEYIISITGKAFKCAGNRKKIVDETCNSSGIEI